ncbi:MAG: hypothetical protein ACK2UY_11250 [Anaerolineae bacterium]
MKDIGQFSDLVLDMPLRAYQLAPLAAVLDSIINQKGIEFLLVFPRQSGKNEAVAQLLAYVLNLYHRTGGNVVYGAVGDQLGVGIERLEARLANELNHELWTVQANPTRRCLGQAAVVFLSSHPTAHVRGQTAHHLLVIDETQDQDAAHIESVFTPMRAANNATALYIGTVKTSHDYLWQKKRELETETERDGVRRVFMIYPDEVCREVRAYQDFLEGQLRKYGRYHPIIASEYYLKPIDAEGGLFPPRRLLLMRGDHPRLLSPLTPAPSPPWERGDLLPPLDGGAGGSGIYVATLDVAGEDEGATDPLARLAHPGRDYTVATIFRVLWPGPGEYAPGPTYEAVDVFVDHGSKHFQAYPGRPPLVQRLAAWLQAWDVAHVVADESGVGQGLVSSLAAILGAHRVTGYSFAGSGQKARLGSLFLSLVETGRFRYWTGDEEQEGSDGWWFWRQAEACVYDLPPDGRFDRHLKWEVPTSHRTATAQGLVPTHDDRLLSAALVAQLDHLARTCGLALGRAESIVIAANDPFDYLEF